MNSSKSAGLDGISGRFLRVGVIANKVYLTHIINLFNSSSSVTKDFKGGGLHDAFL